MEVALIEAAIANVAAATEEAAMRCYYVLVHGRLEWKAPPSSDVSQPRGFYCHRYVLAADEQQAAKIAFERVRLNLDRDDGWLSDGSADLQLQAEEVSTAPFLKLLKPDNRGHTFYEQE
jgi:hypothetical protein